MLRIDPDPLMEAIIQACIFRYEKNMLIQFVNHNTFVVVFFYFRRLLLRYYTINLNFTESSLILLLLK